MAMSGPKSGGGDDPMPVAEINVTPLVDVMLVLLIIFMVTAPIMMSQLPITLPKASIVPSDVHKDPIIVSIDPQGNYSIDLGEGKVEGVTYDALPTRLAELAKQDPTNLVYVKAGRQTMYGKVVELLAVVGSAGFDKVSVKADLGGGGDAPPSVP